MRARTAFVLPLAFCAALPVVALRAQTGAITIYRCVDPVTGAVALQNDAPCQKGQQQTVRKLDPPPPERRYSWEEEPEEDDAQAPAYDDPLEPPAPIDVKPIW